MKPNPCWVVLHVSVLAALLLSLNADGEDSKCETEIRVRRNTVHEVVAGQELRIYCPVVFCNSSPPTVSWIKLEKTAASAPVSNDTHIETVWTTKHEVTSSLVFKHILSSDSGSYQCHSGGSISHSINVYVNDKKNTTTAAWNNVTTVSTPAPEHRHVWMYAYASAGIVVFVVMVIVISVLSMQGCKGKSKRETHTDNQYMQIPMAERPSSQASPRGSPLAPLPQRSTRRKPQEDQPGHNQHVYGQIREDRQRRRDVGEEEGSSVVYAALNHQLPPRAAARPPRLLAEEERSEYAAIRVS